MSLLWAFISCLFRLIFHNLKIYMPSLIESSICFVFLIGSCSVPLWMGKITILANMLQAIIDYCKRQPLLPVLLWVKDNNEFFIDLLTRSFGFTICAIVVIWACLILIKGRWYAWDVFSEVAILIWTAALFEGFFNVYLRIYPPILGLELAEWRVWILWITIIGLVLLKGKARYKFFYTIAAYVWSCVIVLVFFLLHIGGLPFTLFGIFAYWILVFGGYTYFILRYVLV